VVLSKHGLPGGFRVRDLQEENPEGFPSIEAMDPEAVAS
jgi:hypothetical protein